MVTFLPGQRLKASRLQGLADRGTYTPALTATGTSPTLGNGATQAGWWHRNGRLITGGAIIQFGATGVNPGSGFYRISIPFAGDMSVLTGNGAGRASTIGAATMSDDNNTSTFWVPGSVYMRDATIVEIQTPAEGLVSDDIPWTWAANDGISISFAYLADSSALP